MHVVIEIPENVIESAKSNPNYYPTYHFEKIWRAIASGIPIPKGHGRIIDESRVTGTFTWDNGFIECFAPTIIEADMESEDKNISSSNITKTVQDIAKIVK